MVIQKAYAKWEIPSMILILLALCSHSIHLFVRFVSESSLWPLHVLDRTQAQKWLFVTLISAMFYVIYRLFMDYWKQPRGKMFVWMVRSLLAIVYTWFILTLGEFHLWLILPGAVIFLLLAICPWRNAVIYGVEMAACLGAIVLICFNSGVSLAEGRQTIWMILADASTFLLVMAMLTRCFVRQRFAIISIPCLVITAFTLLVDAIVMGAGLTEMSAHYPLAVVFLGLSILTEIPVWLAPPKDATPSTLKK